jgi:hypothetical protein
LNRRLLKRKNRPKRRRKKKRKLKKKKRLRLLESSPREDSSWNRDHRGKNGLRSEKKT